MRLRAWLSRPVLDVRIDLEPHHPPTGYPWHAYYAARFAWRDDRAALLRGVNGSLRANYNGQDIVLSNPTVDEFFDTTAFSTPAAAAFCANTATKAPHDNVTPRSVNRLASIALARASRPATVPSGTPSCRATSLRVRPSKSHRTTTDR